MADKNYRAAPRVGMDHTQSQPVQQSSAETQKSVEPRTRQPYSGSNRDVRLQTERFEELVVQVHLARTPDSREHAITGDQIAAFIAKRRQAGLAIASINRQLEVLRRMLKLAVEWGKVERLLPKAEMLSGENRSSAPTRRRGIATCCAM